MSQTKLAVLGVGNILEKDDGIAVYATAYLEKNYTFSPPIEIINGGVEGINLLNLFMEYEPIIILDAIEIEDEAGSIYHIPSEELTGYGLNSGGAHEVGVLQCIDMLELMGKPLPRSSVLGIIPETLEVHIGLTPRLEACFSAYIEALLEILKKEQITVAAKAQSVSLQEVIKEFQHPSRIRS